MVKENEDNANPMAQIVNAADEKQKQAQKPIELNRVAETLFNPNLSAADAIDHFNLSNPGIIPDDYRNAFKREASTKEQERQNALTTLSNNKEDTLAETSAGRENQIKGGAIATAGIIAAIWLWPPLGIVIALVGLYFSGKGYSEHRDNEKLKKIDKKNEANYEKDKKEINDLYDYQDVSFKKNLAFGIAKMTGQDPKEIQNMLANLPAEQQEQLNEMERGFEQVVGDRGNNQGRKPGVGGGEEQGQGQNNNSSSSIRGVKSVVEETESEKDYSEGEEVFLDSEQEGVELEDVGSYASNKQSSTPSFIPDRPIKTSSQQKGQQRNSGEGVEGGAPPPPSFFPQGGMVNQPQQQFEAPSAPILPKGQGKDSNTPPPPPNVPPPLSTTPFGTPSKQEGQQKGTPPNSILPGAGSGRSK